MEQNLTRILTSVTATRVAAALVAIVAVVVIVKLVNGFLTRTVTDPDARYRSRKMVTFVGYVLAFLLVAAIVSGNLSAFGLTVGVIGAAVAFALQSVIASIAGWVGIMTGRPFRVGDRVQLGDIQGDVIDIGLFRTTLMEVGGWVRGDLYDGRIVRISNAAVLKDPIYNASGDFPFLWDEITIPVRHGCDHRLARETLLGVLQQTVGEYAEFAQEAWIDMVRKYRIEEARVSPWVSLRADENWMTFTARYVVDYRKRRSTKDALWAGILDAFAASGGQLRLATTALEISEGSVVEVRQPG